MPFSDVKSQDVMNLQQEMLLLFGNAWRVSSQAKTLCQCVSVRLGISILAQLYSANA